MNLKKNTIIIIAIIFVCVVGVVVYHSRQIQIINVNTSLGLSDKKKDYNPQINPEDFTTKITNKYFSLPVGKKLFLKANTESGVEEITIEISGETKVIEGVKTLVYLDTVHKNGVIYEITRDYLAQHKKTGDVWYFGEDVNNYDEKGNLKDHAGTFIHGKDGAKAGIWIKAKQIVGETYKQEYYKGVAEDIRDTVSIGQTVKTSLGVYKDCVKVYDWTPLDPESREYKYYCPSVGSLVLTEHLVTGKRSELIKVVDQ